MTDSKAAVDCKKRIRLFDCNGSIGSGAAATPDFPKTYDLLQHMDRLGIDSSLVWHTGARDYNPMWGNRKLVDEIQATVGAEERLFPALTLAPTMLYEKDALKELKGIMSSKGIKALRYFADRSKAMSMGQLEPLMKEIEEFSPLLLIDSREPVNEEEVIKFAGRFPQITIIYTQAMWVDLVSVMNVMRHRKNVMTDNSWIHTNGTIELLVKNFGAERLVFGTGPQSHQGAAIAALICAELSEEERKLIAHGNMEKLLGKVKLKQINRFDNIRNIEQENFWGQLVSGNRVYTKIIDSHGHLGAISNCPLEEVNLEVQVHQLMHKMNRLGIERIVVSSLQALFTEPVEGNRHLREKAGHLKSISGYLAFNPHYAKQLTPLLDNFFEDKFFIGFKLLCDYWGVAVIDRVFNTIWEYADRHRLPVLLHTWEGNCNSPAMLKDIVRKYPNATFILGHSGGGDRGRREAEVLAQENRNVYLEWCGSFTAVRSWEDTIEVVGKNRILFGTDAAMHDPAWELGRLLSQKVEDKVLAPILGGNMEKVLGRRR